VQVLGSFPLWQTFVCTTIGVPVPVLAALPTQPNLPRVKCGCKQFDLDFYGDHVSTCKSHSGATKSHDWMVGQLRPLFQTTGHKVKTQGITQSSGLKRGGLEIDIRQPFGDTVSHLPVGYYLHASVPDAEGSCFNCFSQRKSLPDPDTSPSQASHLATCDPEREEPPCTARGK
jgi:hypothetical protein